MEKKRRMDNEKVRMMLECRDKLVERLNRIGMDGDVRIDKDLESILNVSLFNDYLGEIKFFVMEGHWEDFNRGMENLRSLFV